MYCNLKAIAICNAIERICLHRAYTKTVITLANNKRRKQYDESMMNQIHGTIGASIINVAKCMQQALLLILLLVGRESGTKPSQIELK